MRAVLRDRLGRAFKNTAVRQTYELHTTPEGASEADPDAFLEAVWHCTDAILAKAAKPAEKIAAVASCTLVSNVLGLDAQGQALTPLTTYADTRARPKS